MNTPSLISSDETAVESIYVTRLKMMSQMLGEVEAGTWRANEDQGAESWFGNIKHVAVAFDLWGWIEPSECGYAACAIGHACLDQRMNDMGLRFDGSVPIFIDPDAEQREWAEPPDGWEAVCEMFNISEPVAEWMFSESRYLKRTDGTPLAVKDRVDQLIKFGCEAVEAEIAAYEIVTSNVYPNVHRAWNITDDELAARLQKIEKDTIAP